MFSKNPKYIFIYLVIKLKRFNEVSAPLKQLVDSASANLTIF